MSHSTACRHTNIIECLPVKSRCMPHTTNQWKEQTCCLDAGRVILLAYETCDVTVAPIFIDPASDTVWLLKLLQHFMRCRIQVYEPAKLINDLLKLSQRPS